MTFYRQKNTITLNKWQLTRLSQSTPNLPPNIFIALILLVGFCWPATAQIVPDRTLPVNSTVTNQGNINQIDGGTTAGTNLFHSFEEFSLPTGGEAFFNNALEIQNIFSRVTGNSISNIDGLIRANGAANLFLMNPNGIIFGPNAQLNIGGSFLASTANSLLFPDRLEFNANVGGNGHSPLLSVNVPIGLQMGTNPVTIMNQASATNSDGNITGLEVPTGQSLALIGGDITIDGGGLNAPGGRIELGGLAGQGNIGLTVDNQGFSFEFPENSGLANIALANDARVSVRGIGGGDIVVNANDFMAANRGRLVAGTEGAGDGGDIFVNANNVSLLGLGLNEVSSGLYSESFAGSSGNVGQIIIDTNSLSVSNGATLFSSTAGSGNGGNISVEATGLVSLDNAFIISSPSSEATGNGGNIAIQADAISIDFSNITSFASAQGNGGNILLNANGLISVNGLKFNEQTLADQNVSQVGLISTGVNEEYLGNGGNINISSAVFSMDGGFISAETFGEGNAGNIFIKTAESVSLTNVIISTGVNNSAIGLGGDISIETGSLFFDSLLSTGTFGQGSAGNIIIQATERVNLAPNSIISSSVGDTGVGSGGEILIETGSLLLNNNAVISSGTLGQGNAGNISIQTAQELNVAAGSVIGSSVGNMAAGNGGDIFVEADSLLLNDSASIFSSTFGEGNAGNISIQAHDTVTIFNSSISASVESTAIGDSGDISIEAGSLSLSDAAFISSNTSGQGDAGNIFIQTDDRVTISDSFISSIVNDLAIGNGGDISIQAGFVSLTDSALIFNRTQGVGNAGNILIQTEDRAIVSDSVISSNVDDSAIGNGGNIEIESASLNLSNLGLITASTEGQGDGGNILVRVEDAVSLENASSIDSSVFPGAVGKGGNIDIEGRSLALFNGSIISTAIFPINNDLAGGNGQGGIIRINTNDSIVLSGVNNDPAILFRLNAESYSSAIVTATAVGAKGQGGDILLNTSVLQLRDGALISAETENDDRGGNITINADRLFGLDGSQIVSSTSSGGNAGRIILNVADQITFSRIDPIVTERPNSGVFANTSAASTGNGGTVNITTGELLLSDQAQITVSSDGDGPAGNLTITAESLRLDDRAVLSAETIAGDRGNLFLNTADLILTDNSQITTNARGQATGGNITINTDNLAALENSDISANSQQSQGGNVTINAEGIFGSEFRENQTSESDITATGANSSLSGTVNINTPEVDPTTGLIELPDNIIDATKKLDSPCRPGQQQSEFIVTGRGGIPPNPIESIGDEATWIDLRPMRQLFNRRDTQNRSVSLPSNPVVSSAASQLVEAQGWMINANGNVELVTEAPTVTPHNSNRVQQCDR